jgi:hypothetical protein
MTAPAWTPGDAIHLRRGALELRTLTLGDVPEGAAGPAWYGNDDRRQNLWAPPLDTVAYLRSKDPLCLLDRS